MSFSGQSTLNNPNDSDLAGHFHREDSTGTLAALITERRKGKNSKITKTMRTKQKLLALLTVGVLGISGTANALTTATLAFLDSTPGSTLSIGDKTFSNFDYQAVNLSGFDANNIQVTASVDASGVYYLTWGGTISTGGAVGPGGSIISDLKLNYTVTASAGTIFMIDQSYTGSAQEAGGATSFLAVDESVYNGVVIVANSHLDRVDLSDPFAEIGDNLMINPALVTVNVTKDIAFGIFGGATAGTGFVTISEVKQSFHQVSVPDGGMTVVLLGAALSGLALIRRKTVA